MGKTYKDGHNKGHRARPRGDEDEQHFHDVPRHLPAAPHDKRPPSPKGQRANNTRRLATTTFEGDGKIFYLDAIQNERGKALRIAEVSKGKRTIILIPAALVPKFEGQLGEVTPTLVD